MTAEPEFGRADFPTCRTGNTVRRVELSRDIYNRRRTHNSRNSAGRRYIRNRATTSTLVMEEVGLELALE